MEMIDYIAICILAWGGIGAICLLFIGIREDIRANYSKCPMCSKRQKNFYSLNDYCKTHLNELLNDKDFHLPMSDW